MLTRILSISLIILLVGLFFLAYKSNKLSEQLSAANDRIAVLQANMAEYQRINEVYAESAAKAEEFNKELNDDTNVDNLDVVPADYILKQLRAD
ncbi:MAG: hypothetical protein J6W96_04910 [Alphaproteobacteria bacterium]|nr:hypothetical protein [Alphaproteobacteria bacterium]